MCIPQFLNPSHILYEWYEMISHEKHESAKISLRHCPAKYRFSHSVSSGKHSAFFQPWRSVEMIAPLSSRHCLIIARGKSGLWMAAGEIPWEVDEPRILVPALTLAWLRPRTSTLALPRSDLALGLAQSSLRTATLVCQETIFIKICFEQYGSCIQNMYPKPTKSHWSMNVFLKSKRIVNHSRSE